MSSHTLPDQVSASPSAELRLLPRSRVARAAVWALIAGLSALTFSAWLHPNMVFDLANMMFCI